MDDGEDDKVHDQQLLDLVVGSNGIFLHRG
jgi:hypothetical protein